MDKIGCYNRRIERRGIGSDIGFIQNEGEETEVPGSLTLFILRSSLGMKGC